MDPHPDRLQAYQRAQVRMLCAEADFIVPVEKPNVEAEKLDDQFVAIELGMVDAEEPLPADFSPPEVPEPEEEEDDLFTEEESGAW